MLVMFEPTYLFFHKHTELSQTLNNLLQAKAYKIQADHLYDLQ